MKYEYHSLFIDDEVLILILQVDSGRVSRKKVAVLLDFAQMRGRGGPAQIFWHLFISALLVNNIAKGTTDPRIEFCLLILVISQGQTQNLIKFHLQNIDHAPTSKSRHQQTSVFRLNLKFKILTKPGFKISTKIQLHYHFKTSAAKY